jgi:hypothetical protein
LRRNSHDESCGFLFFISRKTKVYDNTALLNIMEKKNISFDSLPDAVGDIIGKLDAIERILLQRADQPATSLPDNISGCQTAVDFLNKSGYRISLSLMQKETAAGRVPCRKFHNKTLMFSGVELLEWAEKNCKPVGDVSEITLQVASAANSKLRGRRHE